MNKERFEEIISELKFPTNRILMFDEIESIFLNDGSGIFPNWKYLRFFIDKNIYVVHGKSIPYGARLPFDRFFSSGRRVITFRKHLQIEPTSYYQEFRLPKIGDILRASDRDQTISESIIINIHSDMFSTFIELATPLNCPLDSKLSYYDASEYTPNLCMHSNPIEGIYMKFIPNQSKTTYPTVGNYHQIIKPKQIQEINLKVNNFNNNKTFRLS